MQRALKSLLVPQQHGVKLQIMSDLHLELGQQYTSFYIPPSAPYLVLAGDVGRLVDYHLFLSFLRLQCERFVRVFMVLGNHEFYGVTREEGLRLATSLEHEPALQDKFVVLNRRRIDMDEAHHPNNITILGCTLQSYILPEAREIVGKKIKDFQRIVSWTIDDHNAEHAEDVEWLQNHIRLIRKEKNSSRRRIVVITHHAPVVREASRPEDFGNPWSSAFGTDLLDLDSSSVFSEVQWWIFGHTHYTTEFSKGNVKLVSNQRGYVFPKNPEPVLVSSTSLQLIRRFMCSSNVVKNSFDVKRVLNV